MVIFKFLFYFTVVKRLVQTTKNPTCVFYIILKREKSLGNFPAIATEKFSFLRQFSNIFLS